MSPDSFPYTPNALSEIQVSYQCEISPKERIKIRGSRDAEEVFRQIWPADVLEYKEQFYVLCLNRSNEVLGYFLHSVGGLSGTIVDIKQILAVALKSNSASILMAHNHPSSNNSPSEADKMITKRIVKGAALLDVSVLDHLIITAFSYFSFADEGILPEGKTYDTEGLKD